MTKSIQTLEKNLDVVFSNKELLHQALIHRSYLNEAKGTYSSNERLEFLGDAILSFLVSHHLFIEYPTFTEGELTNLRSAVVRTETLSVVSHNLNLGDFLLLSKGEEESGGRINSTLLANCFEAVVGAIFIDQGIEKTKEFIEKKLLVLLAEIIEKRTYRDFKSQFQEMVQERLRLSPLYKVMNEEGPDHAKVFHIGVYVSDELYGVGIGKSKQEAEQAAAAQGLEKWTQKS